MRDGRQSAWDSLTKLVVIGAGPSELQRYQQLAAQVTVVPDHISEWTKVLTGKGLKSAVNRAVFGTGVEMRMLTVAGASSFVRRAMQKEGAFSANCTM